MGSVDILLTVQAQDVDRYTSNLAGHEDFNLVSTTTRQAAIDVLDDRSAHVDVLVIDNLLDNEIHDFVTQIRASYPRLLIILVDEDADFGMPGQADDLSTEPFVDGDLAKRIERMIGERRMETLRSDSLPAVRTVNKTMKEAVGVRGKQEAAVNAVIDLGYDYVAYYHIESESPLEMTLTAQAGPKAINSIAPKTAGPDDLMGWVAQNGQSRLAGPDDSPNHPLVARGRLGAVSCVPVAQADAPYGVIAACRDRPESITQDNILMLELVGVQLAAALRREMNTG